MASAYNPGCNQPRPSPCTEESSKILLKNTPDADLLDEPYAQAVLQMGYHRQDILQAVKTLQKRELSLKASEVLQELMHMESCGRVRTSEVSDSASEAAAAAAAPATRRCLKRPASSAAARDPYGSDGEEREEDRESLEGDGGGGGEGRAAVSEEMVKVGDAVGGCGAEPKEPPAKRASVDQGGVKAKERADMRRRLLALREENRRLRARHLCRKCLKQPVTLTFLPCGHFSFCQQCGQSFQTCPFCQKPILADVRTFLA